MIVLSCSSTESSVELLRLRARVADLEKQLSDSDKKAQDASDKAETLQSMMTSLLPSGMGASKMFTELVTCKQEKDQQTKLHQQQLNQLQMILQQVRLFWNEYVDFVHFFFFHIGCCFRVSGSCTVRNGHSSQRC
jgi:phage shock protein A